MPQAAGQPGGSLRLGFTTGTCASAAAKAAVQALFAGVISSEVAVGLPGGERVTLPVRVFLGHGYSLAEVVKDAGDDPDITHGAVIQAKAEPYAPGEVRLEAGAGIGRVTKPGLAVPVGEPAINPVPREMILQAIREALPAGCGIRVTLSIPGGEELARRTMNPRLGIVGGLSILGTTGWVRPMSQEALLESLIPQIDVAVAAGHRTVALTPGAQSRKFGVGKFGFEEDAVIEASNFVGAMLEACAKKGVRKVLLWGSAGKLVKVAAGIFHTHSRVADARRETVAAWAAARGAAAEEVKRILSSSSVEEMREILEACGLSDLWDFLAAKASEQAASFVWGELEVGTVLLDRRGEILGRDEAALGMMEELRRRREP